MSHAPCYWPVDYSTCNECEPLTALAPDERAKFEQIAADMMWAWSDRLFGVCDVVVRPCRANCAGAPSAPTFWGRGPYAGAERAWSPVLIAGVMHNIGCGCAGLCSCAEEGPTSLRLPGPVQAVTEVLIDGDVVPPESYRVMYSRLLVRTDGGVWPACQNLVADATTDLDTFQVSYRKGVPVPVGGQMATGILACELAKAYCNDATCRLPQRLQTVTRQGVTIGFQDSFEDLKEGGTGIWAIDSWITTITKPRPNATVRSVDIPVGRGAGHYDRH